MAIEKVKTKQIEWTPASLTQVGVAAGLVLISFILGYVAFRKFMLKRAFANALYYYDTNRHGNAVPALEDALGWNANHHVARELYAKLKTEGGDLIKAEDEYKKLVEHPEWKRKETVLCGLGVVYLRKADRECKGQDPTAEWKAADPLIKQAQTFFTAARTANNATPEAHIGLLHCDLFAARRAPGGIDRAKFKTIADGFDKLLKILTSSSDSAKIVTREGLVDLYAGLGFANAVQGTYSAEASRYFKACHQYAPKWALPKINLTYIEAQRYAESDYSLADLKSQQLTIMKDRNELQNLWKTQAAVYGALEEPWFQYCLATCYAFAKRKDLTAYGSLAHGLMQDDKLRTRLEPHLMHSVVYYQFVFDPAVVDNLQKSSYMDQFYLALDRVRTNEQVQKPENAHIRAAVLHNIGVTKEFLGRTQRREPFLEEAMTQWKEAIKAQEGYETYRNMAVLQKRRNKPDAQEWYQLAMKHAANLNSDMLKQDATNFKEFMERR